MLATIIVSPLMMVLAQNEEIDNIVEQNSKDDFTHTVLCEFGSYSTCTPCTYAAQYLYDIFESGTLDFYCVSLVYDKNLEAHERLTDDYNIYGLPTCYFDGVTLRLG